MGEVYKARDTRLGRTVAIKVLPEHVATDPELKRRFEREAKTISSLNHPHICSLYDVGDQDGTSFLVMEYVDGERLADRLRRDGPLALDDAARYAAEIADALEAAHEQGIIHRDLKPGNVMLTRAGSKVLDFGIATHVATAGGEAATRSMAALTAAAVVVAATLVVWGCGDGPGARPAASTEGDALLLSVSVFATNEDGSPKPLPARLVILTPDGGGWSHRFIEDPDSNVFHKAMIYRGGGTEGILTLGGAQAAVKLWRPDGSSDTLWEADFGGEFSRMRDAEVGDIYGDGSAAIAVATHDQGVVVVLQPDGSGGFSVDQLDAMPDTIVHEIELGDLDGDGTIEIYATPSAPNEVDGTPQQGAVVRYVPATGEGPVVVADLGTRHAKEILVADVDGDGRDELYVSVEAVSGGQVEIRRYDADTDPAAGRVIATLDDQLCRFLTVGDVDGDGVLEIVAATHRAGLWLLRRAGDGWETELIAADSSSFEHAAILLDLDGDGRDELYVASDDQGEVRRYSWENDGWQREIILEYTDGFPRFTWNIMSAPVALLPA